MNASRAAHGSDSDRVDDALALLRDEPIGERRNAIADLEARLRRAFESRRARRRRLRSALLAGVTLLSLALGSVAAKAGAAGLRRFWVDIVLGAGWSVRGELDEEGRLALESVAEDGRHQRVVVQASGPSFGGSPGEDDSLEVEAVRHDDATVDVERLVWGEGRYGEDRCERRDFARAPAIATYEDAAGRTRRVHLLPRTDACGSSVIVDETERADESAGRIVGRVEVLPSSRLEATLRRSGAEVTLRLSDSRTARVCEIAWSEGAPSR